MKRNKLPLGIDDEIVLSGKTDFGKSFIKENGDKFLKFRVGINTNY